MTTRLLVVGGNGFIGRHVVARALRMNWEVVSLGLSRSNPPGTKGLVANIADEASLIEILGMERFTYVVNCAGYVDHSSFRVNGRQPIDTHFNGVLNLVRAIDRSSIKRFVNIGSSDEYGSLPAPQSESMRETPISPYSLAKVAAAHFLQMMHRTENFPAVTLRLFLTYGPGQDNRRLLPQIIQACLKNCTFPVTMGEQLRDFCFIDDTVRAVFSALQSDDAVGEIINIGSGVGVPIKSVVEKICGMVGFGKPQFGALRYRDGESMALYADTEKAQKLLRFYPEVDFETGLQLTIDACRCSK